MREASNIELCTFLMFLTFRFRDCESRPEEVCCGQELLRGREEKGGGAVRVAPRGANNEEQSFVVDTVFCWVCQ